MGGLYLGYYNTSKHGFGHVLLCMPDKFIQAPLTRVANNKKKQCAVCTLYSKNVINFPHMLVSFKPHWYVSHTMSIKSENIKLPINWKLCSRATT